jgi:hypothetical protein
VGEVEEGLVGDHLINGHLLYAENDLTTGEVLLDKGASLLIFVVGKDALLRGLDLDADVGVSGQDLFYVGGRQGSSALPNAFVLLTDAYPMQLLHAKQIIECKKIIFKMI